MSNYFGIYIGNTTTSIAQFREDGKVEILANEAGERITAAVVTLSSKEQVVGGTAGVTSYSLAPSTVRNNKNLLDNSLSEESLSQFCSQSFVKIEGSKTDELIYKIYETDQKPLEYKPFEIATMIFKKLYGIGLGAAPGQSHLYCVLCVPKHWTEHSRQIIEKAASLGGWEVIQTINEPPAALLAYKIGFESVPTDTIAVVYRLGGVSCDATVIRVEGGFYTILSHIRRDNLGGKDIINLLTEHLAFEFKRKYRLEPTESRKSMWKLKIAATGILHTLSTVPSCSRFIESVCEGVDFNASISRARIEAFVVPLLPKFTEPITEALAVAKVDNHHVSKIVLCGGVLKIPKLSSSIASMFNGEVFSSMNPDEVLAFGAAQQAGLIANIPQRTNLKSDEKLPFLKEPILVKINEEEITINKSALPIFHQVNLSTTEPNITIKAIQTLESGNLKGETTISFDKVPGQLDIHINATENDELCIEAIDTASKDVKKSTLCFQT